ncbi:MAG: ABC transporter substrate-binding protein, partial [Pseudomonadota bacterium]
RSGYKCDVVIGVATGWELGLATPAYYRSSWALAYLEGGKLDGVRTPNDLISLPDDLKQSVSVATFVGTPASVWLSRHDLDYKLRPYQALDADPNRYPGQLIENDLRDGEVDAVVLWGPVAGYFAKRVNELSDGPDVVVIPLESGDGLKFDYTIASGVRYGDGERRALITKLLEDTAPQIEALLSEYGFPLLPIGEQPVDDDDDDD